MTGENTTENTVQQGAPGEQGNAAGENAGARTVTAGCLLHGFGAGPEDLLPLRPLLGPDLAWIAPRAPVPLEIHGSVWGHAWFPRDTREQQEALSGSYFQRLQDMEPPGLLEAARVVRAAVDEAGFDWSRLVLVGFSQGAMVAAELLRQALKGDGPMPAGAVLFSGALLARRWWEDLPSRDAPGAPLQRAAVFQSHGDQDPILPEPEGRALADVLQAARFPLEWRRFAGDHTIPPVIAREAGEFLRRIG
ncbi:alpha/beta hydrolase [Alkalispirochaeta sphaeroplastigenens]|nr:alpha/beta hydrolase fold domain-containing protein [Alkalispirochaeta sphaeroplastigenens]